MWSQTPSTPSTAGVYDAFQLVATEELIFIDFCEETEHTPSQWCNEAKQSLEKLHDALKDVTDNDSYLDIERIFPLSLHEEVEQEIQRVIHGEIATPRTIDEIEAHVRERVSNSEYSLKTSELATYYADEKFEKYFRNLKLQLSLLNAAPLVIPESNQSSGCVSFQFYKTVSKREVELLEIDFPLNSSLLDLFTYVCAQLPNDYMFDGPVYAGSGLIVIGTDMYITGDEDYSVPICNWLGPGVQYTVTQMDSCMIGDMPTLRSLCTTAECGFLIFNGEEEIRFFVSNIKFSKMVENAPAVRFKRKITRITRCVLCKTTAADLVVINDTMLPYNPSHCCTRCYRRFRADRSGQFIPPSSPDVIVSVYKQT